MAGGIYLIQDDDRLVEMMEQPYDSEDQLQDLLVTYPNLIAGDQIDRATARRWLLISREPAPSEEETAVQWSLDHLFLDQNAVPTLVDVRRTPNAELRQKVLGQSIDYAANALFTGRSIQLLLCLKLIVAIGVAIPNRFLKSFSVQMLMKRDFGRRLKLICKPVKFA
jgi:hypothetical protein